MEEERLDGRDLEATRIAHEALMSAYALVWDELSLIRSRRELMERLALRAQSLVDGPLTALVRYFVESHARRQLCELRAVYVRLLHARTPPAFSVGDGQVWLREAAADAARFVEALPRRDWLWEMLLSSLALLPGSALAWLLEAQWRVDAQSFVRMVVGAAVGVVGAWGLTTAHESFEAKRRLFGARIVGQRLKRRESIYQREDDRFKLLGRAKRKESPLDAIVSIATLLVTAGFSFVSAINGFRMHHVAGGILLIVLAALLLGGAAGLAQRARQRLPH